MVSVTICESKSESEMQLYLNPILAHTSLSFFREVGESEIKMVCSKAVVQKTYRGIQKVKWSTRAFYTSTLNSITPDE